MNYPDLRSYLRSICDGTHHLVKGVNFMTPDYIGCRKHVEISMGKGLSGSLLIGVTFPDYAAKYSRCFCEEEHKTIAKYIDTTLLHEQRMNEGY